MMIKNSLLSFCFVVIVACLYKINKLNNIVRARVIPSVQSTPSYNALCARVVDVDGLNEFISFHISQGFLTYILYIDDENVDEIRHVYDGFGLELRFKQAVDNIEWDCILDASFDPTISHVVILNSNEFIFPLETKNNVYIDDIQICHLLEEYSFIDSDDGNLVTKNIKREIYTNFKNKKAIIPIGTTSADRVGLLRNYSMKTLYNNCILSRSHGVANLDGDIESNFVNDKRLLKMHDRVTLHRH